MSRLLLRYSVKVLRLLLTNRVYKDIMNIVFNVFDWQAQVPCAVASDAKVTLCKYHAYYFAIPSLRSLRIASIRILRISTLTYSTSKRKFLARLRLTRKSLYANITLITSLFRRFAPYESRLYGYYEYEPSLTHTLFLPLTLYRRTSIKLYYSCRKNKELITEYIWTHLEEDKTVEQKLSIRLKPRNAK